MRYPLRDPICIPTGVRGNGTTIYTRYHVGRSRDVAIPVKALNHFRRAHPVLAYRLRAGEMIDELGKLERTLLTREFDEVIAECWDGARPLWPDDDPQA